MEKKISNDHNAYVITGPTSGIGLATAMELSKHGTVILVGRNKARLAQVQKEIEAKGGQAVPVICDISDMVSVKQAARQIAETGLPVAGIINNAGIMTQKASKSAQGWDLTFATNHLGTFAFTEALIPRLQEGTRILFVVSAIEDPERKPVKVMGMKGGRFISVEAGARGEWKEGGTRLPGIDAYATSKQCILAAAMALARETPGLYINAVEPGITQGTRLGAGDTNAVLHYIFGKLMAFIPPFSRYSSTPAKTAVTLTKIMTGPAGTGIYYDEKGRPMRGSELAENPDFQNRVLAETRAFLAKNNADYR